MKKMKNIYLSFILCVICGTAFAQTLTISNVEVKPGDKATFTATVNVGDKFVNGFKLEGLVFPEGISLSGKKALNVDKWTRREGLAEDATNDLLFMHNKVDGAYMVTMASPGFSIPTNTDFELFEIEISAAATTPYGKNTITIPNGSFTFVDGDNYFPVGDVTFDINVVDAYSITLDEESTEAPVAAEGVNVTVKRTINANEWGTICLPFEMTEAQVKAAFGEGVELAEYQDFTTEYDENDEPISLDVIFAPATAIEANYPYIIKVAEKVTEFKVENVNIDPEDAIVETDNGKSGRQRQVYSSFIGTYVAGTEMPYEAGERSVFLSGGKFYYATSATKPLKGYRAYFWFVDEIATVPASRISISFNSTTGIKNVNQMNDGEYYNLNGVRVDTPSKGIYIKDGKKVVVK